MKRHLMITQLSKTAYRSSQWPMADISNKLTIVLKLKIYGTGLATYCFIDVSS